MKFRLSLMKKFGDKQVASQVCNQCGTNNYRFVPVNVVAGDLASCENCEELIFFPSPRSPFNEAEAKRFTQLVKDNLR